MPQKISSDIVRKCIICGEEFHPSARKQYCCNKPIIYHCEVCGKEIAGRCNKEYRKSTCSPECSAILAKQKRRKSASNQTKICKWCNKSFVPTSVRDVYCSRPHYKTCEVCGKEFEIDVRKDSTVRSCSSECKKVLQTMNRDFEAEHLHQQDTFKAKYGVTNAMRIPGVVSKIEQTNQSRYGSSWYTQTDEYKQRVKQTSLDKYGTEHFLQSDTVKQKRYDTCNSKYGVCNVSQTDTVKSKIKQVWNDKYGVINISQNHIVDLGAWNSFIENPRQHIQDRYDSFPTVMQLASDLGVCLTSVYNHLDIQNNSDLIQHSHSRMEEEIVNFLRSIIPEIQIKINDRHIIAPYELDIYLPDYNMAIECNPTETHNSSLEDPWGGKPKAANYHKIKTDRCEDVGIFLFHIFGWEWQHKNAIIKSMLCNLLNQNQDKIYARKCNVSEISDTECKEFLLANHRQGYATSPIRLGLTYQDDIVAVMTFSKKRHTISRGDNCYELVRFCNKLNTSVAGGADKLFKFFIKTYNPTTILSYSDRSHTKGGLYDKLGFVQKSISSPGYVWVDGKTNQSYSRIHAQKSNIVKFLDDNTIDLSKTEKQIMIEHGYVQVFDAGNILWEWSNT